MQRRHFLQFSLGSLILGTLAACGNDEPQLIAIPAGATVLALGDSITYGYGANPQTSYPAVLAQITGWNVINAGVSGDTTEGALKRLPGLLQQYAPKLVLTSIGGNDFLRRVPEATTRSNLIAICRQIKDSGAQNMLIAVPKPSLVGASVGSLSDHPMYAEVAREMNIPLQKGGWADVLSDASLRSDQIHANARGYARFAELLAVSLRETGLLKR